MIEPENRRSPRPNDRWMNVPASVRPPERLRFAAHDEEPDETDADIEFLAEIAEAAGRSAKPAQTTPPAHRREFSVPATDHLDVFRESHVERPRPRVLEQFAVENVPLDDLMEQLSTTAAALRHRKAA
jgi:hypothetical protein